MIKKSSVISFVFLAATSLFFSCRSLNQVRNVTSLPDYSDSDVANLEAQRILDLMEEEPVKALWRAGILKNDDILDQCKKSVLKKLNELLEQEKYFEAEKYIISLKSTGFSKEDFAAEKIILSQVENNLYKNVPLEKKNDKVPKKISDCVKATVTVWVDRGVKIKNGAGFADVIIGSGFFIDSRGYLVTNYHVIDSMVNPSYEGYARLYVKLYEDMETKIPAKVVGYDKMLDLALIKAEIEPNVVLSLGSSFDLNVGDRVLAIGSPVGLEGTLTSGIISATDRKLLTLGDVFQVDAAINSGNSGGPLIDEKMNVQAVVFAGMLAYQGLNFAIPVEYLKQELVSLYNENEIIHPWIGAFGKTAKKGSEKKGLEVQYVMPGSPAHLSGLKSGQVIKSVDGKKVQSLEDFQFIMLSYSGDTILQFEVEENIEDENVSKTLCIYLENRPEYPVKQVYFSDYVSNAFYPFFGMKLVSADEANRKTFIVTDVLKNSTAEELHFTPDDVITINSVQLDETNGLLYAQIYAKRKKKGFLDVGMIMQTSLDTPYFF